MIIIETFAAGCQHIRPVRQAEKPKPADAGVRPHQSTTGDRLSLKPYRAHIAIGEDRIVEMSEEDATCLIPVGWTLLTEPRCDGSG
jgi:hypothetical protein